MRFDKYVMAQMNKKMILNMIIQKGPINRAEIARLSGLSVPTVMKMNSANRALSVPLEKGNPPEGVSLN